MWNYETLTPELEQRIKTERSTGTLKSYAFDEANVLRRDHTKDAASLWRPAFIRDADKILHCPYYNRYADKTQVFSFYKNDDITRRALHVQLVSRIARNIGVLLGLNIDLIEAIALGHDLGHTPFGHAGERALDDFSSCGFAHYKQSVRVVEVLEKDGFGAITSSKGLKTNSEDHEGTSDVLHFSRDALMTFGVRYFEKYEELISK